MRHIFLINPHAGTGANIDSFRESVTSAASELNADAEIIETESAAICEKKVHELAERYNSEGCTFYACGGDGTICSVVNGAVGFENVSISVVPVGTGNDFVRNFTDKQNFMDPKALMSGNIIDIDLIKYNDRYLVNMLNTGFDCEVVKKAMALKKTMPGSLAYLSGVFVTLVKKPGVKMKVSVDGGKYIEKDLLLTCIANGAFCGGGFNSTPYASINDGTIDVSFVNNVTRAKFISLLSAYKDGSYLIRKDAKNITSYRKCKKLDIVFSKTQSVSIDGEIEEYNKMTISVAEKALKFRVPAGSVLKKPIEIPASVLG